MTGSEADATPSRVRRAAPLTRREKAWVAAVTAAPMVVVAAVLLPVALLTTIAVADALGATAVYGGLLSLTAAFVATDRVQARQCPRCAGRQPKGDEVCPTCGYDLVDRPRYACSERHVAYLDDAGDGRCACGRYLERLPSPRGVGPQVVATLKIGAFLLAFLVAMGVILNAMEGRL